MKRNPNNYDIQVRFHETNSKLNSDLNLAKSEYFGENFAQNSSMRNQWQTIKKLLNMPTESPEIALKINNEVITDVKIIANEFNNYFNSIPGKVKQTAAFTDWRPPPNHVNSVNSLYLAPITSDEIQNVVKGFANKGAGADGISTSLLKSILNCILEPLVYLFNQWIVVSIQIS